MTAIDMQHIVDTLAIQALLADYAYAIDAKDWDGLDAVFLPDAQIDYSAMGGEAGDWSRIKPWLAQAMGKFPLTQHLIGLPQIRITGDRATARTMLFNPMLLRREGQPDHLFSCGCVYHDDLVRTDGGWRIAARVERQGWFQNPPVDHHPPEAE